MVDGSIRGAVPEPLYKQIVLTFNSWNEKHWINKRWFGPAVEKVLHEKGYCETSDAFVSRTNYMCNEFFDDADIAYFENMKVKNPRRYRVEGLGEWGLAEGLIYDNWEELEFDENELVKQRPNIHARFGLDFGYTADPSAFIAFLIDNEAKEIFIFEEHYQKGMLNNEIASMIEYKGYGKEEIMADCAEPKSIEEIKGYGIHRIRPARKGKDSVSNGIQFLQQYKVYVKPSCTNVILELNNYAWATGKDGTIMNVPIDDYNHLMDAWRYGAEKDMKRSGMSVMFEV